MAPQHAYVSDSGSLSAPASAPARLALVATPPVYLTYVESAVLRRTGALWRRQQRRSQAGLVHAAHLHSPLALCGAELDSLEPFGRSRDPFENFDVSQHCTTCHVAAGRPTF